MEQEDRARAAERLRTSLELHDLGVAMTRQRLRRLHPDATEEALQAMLRDWFAMRPGAEWGDGEGHPVPWPRPPR